MTFVADDSQLVLSSKQVAGSGRWAAVLGCWADSLGALSLVRVGPSRCSKVELTMGAQFRLDVGL